MKEKIRTIDLKQYIKYCFEKIFIIIPVVLICMGLLVAINYNEQKGAVESSKKDIINRIIDQNHEANVYNSVKYTDNDPPKGVYNSRAIVYIDFNYSDIELSSGVDVSAYTTKMGNDLTDILVDLPTLEGVIDELDLKKYPEFDNLTAERLKWMINKNFQGAHIVKLVVSDVDPDRAKLIADKILEKFLINVKTYMSVDDVKVIGYPNLPEDGGLFSTSTDIVQTVISKSEIVKYAIVGGILGICIIAAILFVVFVVCDTVRTENDLVFADITQLVNLNRKKIDYKRIAYSIDYESEKSILFMAVDKRIKAETVASAVKDELKSVNKSIKVDYAEDFAGQSEALSKAKNADSVIYLVKYGKTKMKDLIDAKNVIERFGVKNDEGIII